MKHRVSMKKQVHVLYSGRVQGVGFRMTAEEAAQGLGVSGWVRNLRDGRVEMIAEGPVPTLERLLDVIRTGPMKNFIADARVAWSQASDEFHDFEIRYY